MNKAAYLGLGSILLASLFSIGASTVFAAGASLKLQAVVIGGGALTPQQLTLKALIRSNPAEAGVGGLLEFEDTGDSTTFRPATTSFTWLSYYNPYEGNYTGSDWMCTSNQRASFSISNYSQSMIPTEGEQITCTITLTATFVSDSIITLRKEVIGGFENPSDWELLLVDGNGGLDVYEERFGEINRMVAPGTYYFYIAGDDFENGYSNSPITCTGGIFTPNEDYPKLGGRIDIAEDQHIVCMSTAYDISSPRLRLITNIVGGSATSSDWQLSASTPGGAGNFTDSGDSSVFHSVLFDFVYSISESGPPGYTQTGFNCDGSPTERTVGSSTVQIFKTGAEITCTVTLTAAPTKPDPVIIIPGILGSWEKKGQWIIDPVQHTYDNLIDTLLANGYVEGQTLFKFPYDWRSSNITTAFLLKNKIQEVKQVCGCSKVDIIAHSMGGLVASAYIERDDYQNDVDQLFLVATPLEGSPFAYKTWEGGELDFGNLFYNSFTYLFFRNEARKNGFGILPNSIYDYIHGWPIVSIQELLPVNKNYLSTATTTLQYPNGYPVNNFLETLDSNFKIKVANRVNLKVIEADTNNSDTLNGIIVKPSIHLPKWQNGEPTANVLGAGDGTVPFWSTEDVASSSVKFLGTNHNQAVSTSIGYIFKQIKNIEPNPIISKTYSAAVSFLYFELFSPIDMQIIAPDGKRLGKDFNTNAEIDEIPDAFYSGFETDNEYAVIVNPLPGTYTIKTIGTGSGGRYAIVGDYIDTQGDVNAEIDGTTTAGQIIDQSFNLSTTDRSLKVPYRWDGFLQPINNTGHQITSNTNVFKAGSTVPVKFQLKNSGGTVVQASTIPLWLTPQKGSAMSTPVDETVYTDAATSGSSFKWDSTLQGYTYNWSTKGLAGGYWYKISVKFDDGTTQWAYVGLR